MGRFAHPRNKRLPIEAYCDPQRIVFFTIRAMEHSSPFGVVRPGGKVHFNEALCDRIIETLYQARDDYDGDVIVVCLMPDHVHFLARPRREGANVLILADRFKGKTTNESWKLGHHGRLWQPRNFDHVIRRDESVYEKAEYILNNPVRKGFVKKYEDWPYWRRWDPAPW